MYKKMTVPVLFTAIMLIAAAGCQRKTIYEEIKPKTDEFDITDYYIAGTLTPQTKYYTVVYCIKLLENNKAVFVESQSIEGLHLKSYDYTLVGQYRLTEDSIIVTVDSELNPREARFAINQDHVITSAYYRQESNELITTGNLLEIGKTNQFAGKVFKGTRYRLYHIGDPVWYYKFDATGTKYGVGDNPETIVMDETPEIINNSTFRIQGEGGGTQMGFVKGDTLAAFATKGTYFFGKYGVQ